MQRPGILAIVGATATGKSSLGLALAGAIGGEIVNADALQVYRGLDIGTAKPTPEERRRVPHHLIDLLDPEEPWSAGEFARRARPVLDEIRGRGRLPVVVGGSGFYVHALLRGLAPLPPRQPQVRRELERRMEADGLASLRRELERLDPATAARLAPGDRQRIVRALEVVLATGRPLSQWQAEAPPAELRPAALRVGLTLPRAILYDRIGARVHRMIECGWVEEVAGLLRRGVDPAAPAFQAIGYRQIVCHIRGERALDVAVRDIVLATRRFAKRQETWFRNKEPEVIWLRAGDEGRLLARVLRLASRARPWRGHGEA